jgi:hypothetical protein
LAKKKKKDLNMNNPSSLQPPGFYAVFVKSSSLLKGVTLVSIEQALSKDRAASMGWMKYLPLSAQKQK